MRDVDRADTGRQRQQLGEIPAVQWEVIYLLSDDGNAQFRTRRFQRGIHCLHCYSFFRRSCRKTEIESCRLIYDERDARLHRGRKAVLADPEVIIPGLNVSDDVSAHGIRGRRPVEVRAVVVQQDRRIRNHGT